MGNRAVGKTSVLKHAELLTDSERPQRYLPLFWDLQGTASSQELHQDFADLLEDCGERLQAHGIDWADIRDDDLFRSLGRLCRQLRARQMTLLLLCDEVEELLELRESSPGLLSKLRRALQSQEGIRTVMASSNRLWELAEHDGDTSPFLHGLAPPIYLGSLDEDAARGLVLQEQSPCPSAMDAEQASRIATHCGHHPFLLQLMSARLLGSATFEEASQAVATDPAVNFLFEIDMALLSPLHQEVLARLAERDGGTASAELAEASDETSIHGALLHLSKVGMTEAMAEDRFTVSGTVLRRWLRERSGRL